MCNSGCQELRAEKNGEWPCSGYRAYFGSNKDGLGLGRGSGCPLNDSCLLQMVHCYIMLNIKIYKNAMYKNVTYIFLKQQKEY